MKTQPSSSLINLDKHR